MAFIHQQADWANWHWRDSELLERLAQTRHRQGLLLGRMEALGFDLGSDATLLMLASNAVATSAIEGEVMSLPSARSSLAKRLGLESGGAATTPETEGLADVLVDATQRSAEPLTDDRLFGWHAALFPTGRSGLRRIAAGCYRGPEAGPMQVVSGGIGSERVHFEAPHADRLPEEMERFLRWFNGPACEDLLFRAAIAHLWFLTIHPFEDGNGRIARAIADIVLARSDGVAARFYSMSTQIEVERAAYYEQLESQQRGSLDVTEWIGWFLGCLERSFEAASAQLAEVSSHQRIWMRAHGKPGTPALNERQSRVLQRVLRGFEGPMTTSKYAKVAKCSQDSALRDLSDLVERGVYEKRPGGGRSTSYRLVN